MNKYDVIVISGTSESREVIEEQLKEGKKILACVATVLGAQMLEEYAIDVHIGRLHEAGFVKLFTDYPCDQIIDASHPFAKIVTETVQKAARQLGIPYERYERQNLDYNYDQMVTVSDTSEAIALLNQMEGNVFLTTGVNTAGLYAAGVKDAAKRLYIRVLDNDSSRQGCEKAGYPKSHVYAIMPPFSVEDNLQIIRETGAAVMVSKDSGKRGGVDAKVAACKEAGIPMILIARPKADQPKEKPMVKIPRVLIAGANSGCGKTSITCGILRALVKKGMKVQAYKCGPDYIDPMLHGHITGRDCRNLDPFFSTEEDLRYLMAKDSQDAEFTVVEGVMGYYDGIGVSADKSTHTVSVATQTPTILIINVKGMSHTMIPLIKGLLEYQKNPVKGVILNRCSKGLCDMIKPELEKTLGIKVVGYFPQKEGIYIGSRHLGLMTAAEIENLDEVLDLLGESALETIDLDAIIEIGKMAEDMPKVEKPLVPAEKKARIAVAMDKAFCFYYKENLEILEQMGASLIPFSPVNDKQLPDGIDGIYLGGGYPETYRQELSDNDSMRQSIVQAARDGKPILAECGGFMYVADQLVETDGSSLSMLGLIPTNVRMTKKLSMQFGYVTMETLEDTPFFKKGAQIRVHEFHYSKADQRGSSCVMRKQTGRSWNGLYTIHHIMAGYPHFYFHNCKEVARNFVDLASKNDGNKREKGK